jgi:hypothetical protein
MSGGIVQFSLCTSFGGPVSEGEHEMNSPKTLSKCFTEAR